VSEDLEGDEKKRLWSFQRCSLCQQFSLIKKTGVDLIRAQQSPHPSLLVKGIEFKKIPPPPPRQNRSALWIAGIITLFCLGSAGMIYVNGTNRWTREVEGTQAEIQTPATAQTLAQTTPPQAPPQAPLQADPLAQPIAADPTIQKPETASSETLSLKVQPRKPRVSLRSGPGTQFPVIELADPTLQYPVRDFQDRWFQIELPGNSQEKKMAWIRNDLVSANRASN
jgi:hypothetical protein